MKYNLEFVDTEKIAQTMTNGMADYKLFLWVPEWLQDAEEKEYFVLKNTGTREEKNGRNYIILQQNTQETNVVTPYPKTENLL